MNSLKALAVTVALSVAILSCQTGRILFKTECGMLVRALPIMELYDGGMPPEWSRERVLEAEKWAVLSFKEHVDAGADPRFINGGCSALSGWAIYPMPSRTYDNGFGQQVPGLTNCTRAGSTIGSGDPRHWALAHEMAHIIQRCEPRRGTAPLNTLPDIDHENWNEDGIYNAIWKRGPFDGGVHQ